MTQTKLRRTKPDFYRMSTAPPPRFFGFFLDGGELTAVIYSNAGEWLEDRAAAPVPAPTLPILCIVSDPNQRVGDGTAVWRDLEEVGEQIFGTGITVWDPDVEEPYTYAPEGMEISEPLFLQGYLYWWEWPTGFEGGDDITLTLMRGLCDLTSIEAVGFDVFATSDTNNDALAVDGVALNSTAAIGAFSATGGEAAEYVAVRVVLATGSASQAGSVHDNFGRSYPDAAGTSLGPATSGGLAVYGLPDDTSAELVTRWPSSGSWQIFTLYSFGVTADRARGLLYGDNGSGVIAIEALTSATGGEPISVTSIAEHPTNELGPPGALFLME